MTSFFLQVFSRSQTHLLLLWRRDPFESLLQGSNHGLPSCRDIQDRRPREWTKAIVEEVDGLDTVVVPGVPPESCIIVSSYVRAQGDVYQSSRKAAIRSSLEDEA